MVESYFFAKLGAKVKTKAIKLQVEIVDT